MSAKVTKTAPTYLKEARLAAGYPNRGTASTGVPYSPETIGRHERGEIPVLPEDVLVYAKGYGRGDILIRHCAECPIGRVIGRRVTDRELPFATLRLIHQLNKAAKGIAETLEAIAYDGVVDADERPVFNASIESLKELGETIADLVLYAATQGIEKSRPANAGAAPSKQGYSTANMPPRQPPKPKEEA